MSARIVVLGGGFGGVHTALHLERLARATPDLEITLVSHDNFFLFTPMLHEVAASDLDITHIVSPLRTLLKRTTVFIGDVQAIDLRARQVTVSHGYDRHAHTIPYDQLVVGLGSIANFYGLPGLEQRALTMKSLGDAIHLRNRVIAALEEADTECQRDREGLLTFVVAGGGFAGVETVAGLNDFIHEGLRLYPRIRPERVRTVLVHSGTEILPELGEKLGRYAEQKLRARGVEVLTGARVARVSDESVVLEDGRRIPSRVVVWTAGTSPHPLLHELPCALDRGRIVVDDTLAVPGWPGVWALGDCAVIPDRRTGKPHPPTAQHRTARGPDRGPQHRGDAARRALDRIRLPNDRPAGRDRPSHRRRPDPGRQLLGILRVVAVANDLSEQAAAPRKEASRRDRLDAGSDLHQGLRAVPDRAGPGDVDASRRTCRRTT